MDEDSVRPGLPANCVTEPDDLGHEPAAQLFFRHRAKRATLQPLSSGTAAGFSIPADQLGWAPAFVAPSPADGAVIGSSVTPAAPGVGSAPGTLAFAASGCGFGTNVINAALTLDIPAGQRAGDYSGSMTITYIETQPSGTAGCVPITVGF